MHKKFSNKKLFLIGRVSVNTYVSLAKAKGYDSSDGVNAFVNASYTSGKNSTQVIS